MSNNLTSTELLELAFLVEDKSQTPHKEIRTHYQKLHDKLLTIVNELDALEATPMSFAQIPIVLNKMNTSFRASLGHPGTPASSEGE